MESYYGEEVQKRKSNLVNFYNLLAFSISLIQWTCSPWKSFLYQTLTTPLFVNIRIRIRIRNCTSNSLWIRIQGGRSMRIQIWILIIAFAVSLKVKFSHLCFGKRLQKITMYRKARDQVYFFWQFRIPGVPNQGGPIQIQIRHKE
jgi:hypothetical protein